MRSASSTSTSCCPSSTRMPQCGVSAAPWPARCSVGHTLSLGSACSGLGREVDARHVLNASQHRSTVGESGQRDDVGRVLGHESATCDAALEVDGGVGTAHAKAAQLGTKVHLVSEFQSTITCSCCLYIELMMCKNPTKWFECYFPMRTKSLL